MYVPITPHNPRVVYACLCFKILKKEANTKKKIVLGEDSKKWVERQKRAHAVVIYIYIYIYNIYVCV